MDENQEEEEVGREGGRPLRRQHTAMRTRCVLLVAGFAFVVALPSSDSFDVWWHMRTGQWIVEHGQVPHKDMYSFVSQGAWWVNPSWLADVWFYGLWQVGGLALLRALAAALFASGMALAVASVPRGAAQPAAVAVAGMACSYAVAQSVLVRPLVFSFPLTAWFLWVLRPRRDRWLWTLPLCMALWVNLHAGFAAGLILVFLAFAAEVVALARARERAWRRARLLVATGLACGAACFVNPFGYGVLTYPFRLTGSRLFMSKVLEWMPPTADLAFMPYWVLLGATVLAVIATARRASLFDVLVLAAFAGLSIRARRQMGVFGIVALPVLARHLSLLPWPAGRRARLACATLVGAAALAGVWNRSANVERERLPEKAVDFLAATPLQGRLFSEYDWGGYLIWRLYPRWQVFIDGRCLVHGDKGYREWERIYLCEEGWEQAAEERGVECMLLRHRRPPGADGAPNPLPFASPNWATVYWDDDAAIVLRRTKANAAFIAKHDWTLTNPALVVAPLSRRQRIPEIQAQLERKIALDPDCAVAHENLGLCYLFRGDAKRAGAELAIALRLRPDRASAAFNMGAAAAMQGRVDDALRWFTRAAELNPEEPTYHMAVADAWLRKKNPRQAIAALERALACSKGAQAERVRRRLRQLELPPGGKP